MQKALTLTVTRNGEDAADRDGWFCRKGLLRLSAVRPRNWLDGMADRWHRLFDKDLPAPTMLGPSQVIETPPMPNVTLLTSANLGPMNMELVRPPNKADNGFDVTEVDS